MSIKNSLAAIKKHLPRSLPAEARIRRAELGAYATPADVVSALDRSSSRPNSEKYALVAAIVAEHQSHPQPLWLSILILAFGPMLNALRSDLGWAGDEERDQLVLVAFMNAVARLPATAGAYAAVALRRATAKEIFETEPAELVSFNEDVHSPCTPFALTEAELRVDAAWALRREARLAVTLPREAARLPEVRGTRGSVAA